MIPTSDLVKKLKQEDPIELPMDENFYNQLHNQIMASIEQIEVKPLSRWSKTWVFLELKRKAWPPAPRRAFARKVIKTGFVGLTFAVAIGLASLSAKVYNEVHVAQNATNQIRIIQEARQNPTEWSDLVVSYQNENDFYADVLSQKNDLATLVEIDRVLTESL